MKLAAPAAIGRATRIDDADGRYIEAVKASTARGLDLSGLKIVVDCANGAAYKVAPTVLWELGAEVIPIAVKPDGFNINGNCGSTHPALLQEHVVMHHADIGIALDGDADRVVLVCEKGEPDRRRPADGDHRRPVEAGRQADRQRPGRDGDVQSRAGALCRRARPVAGAHPGRRPLRARAHARRRLQPGRRAVGPHHHDRPCHDRRRADGGAAGAGRADQERQARERDLPRLPARCRSS